MCAVVGSGAFEVAMVDGVMGALVVGSPVDKIGGGREVDGENERAFGITMLVTWCSIRGTRGRSILSSLLLFLCRSFSYEASSSGWSNGGGGDEGETGARNSLSLDLNSVEVVARVGGSLADGDFGCIECW